jgi:hypothetical protein
VVFTIRLLLVTDARHFFVAHLSTNNSFDVNIIVAVLSTNVSAFDGFVDSSRDLLAGVQFYFNS